MQALLDEGAAVSHVESLLGTGPARVERGVQYPYYHFIVSGSIRWLFSRKSLRFDCLVDARTGHAASADPMTTERARSLPDDCLSVQWSTSEAARQASRYAQHAMSRSLRLMSNFNTSLDERGLVYRPFWIVESGTTRILLDAVTAEVHPLTNRVTRPPTYEICERASGTLDHSLCRPRRTDHDQILTT